MVTYSRKFPFLCRYVGDLTFSPWISQLWDQRQFCSHRPSCLLVWPMWWECCMLLKAGCCFGCCQKRIAMLMCFFVTSPTCPTLFWDWPFIRLCMCTCILLINSKKLDSLKISCCTVWKVRSYQKLFDRWYWEQRWRLSPVHHWPE